MSNNILTNLIFIFLFFLVGFFCLPGYAQKNNSSALTTVKSVDNKSQTLLISYDPQIYLLAYQTFLANKNIKHAYLIAKAAVAQRPDDVDWRRRFAQVASWYDKPKVALQQWVYLAEYKKDREAFDKAITIAHMLHDNQLLAKLYNLKIEYGYGYQDAWKGYITAQESLGEPEKAIQKLKKIIAEKPTLYNLEQLGALYNATGNTAEELKTLQTIKEKFGILPKNALRQAEILYSHGKVKEAHTVLMTAASKAKDEHHEFWQAFGQLAWMLQDKKNAKLAYTKLHEAGKIDQGALINYIQLMEARDKQEAFKLSIQGWNQYHDNYFITQVISLAPELQEWNRLATILGGLSTETKQYLAQLPYYYAVQARLFAHNGESQQAFNIYRQALKKFPEDVDLKIDYLWFLIDYQYKAQLRLTLYLWQYQAMNDMKFIPAYAAGYIMLQQPQDALVLLQLQFAQKQQDYNWLINVADTLDQVNRPIDATRMRQLAWYWLLVANTRKFVPATRKNVVDFARVAMYQAPGNITAQTVAQLSQYASNQEADIVLLTWALQLDEYQLADYAWNYYGINQKISPWIQQTIALQNNDRYHLAQLLQDELDKLPYRDRVIAAKRIGQDRLAQKLAYQGLQEHPTDSEMYDLMTTTQLIAADKIQIIPAYQEIGSIRGFKSHLSGRFFVNPRVSVMPWINAWRTRTNDASIILPATNVDRDAGIQINRRYSHGLLSANIGYRDALAGFISAELTGSYRFTSKLFTIMTLGYNQRADESTALLIAGMKDEAKLEFSYQMQPRDSLYGAVSYQNFKSQDDVYLGNGHMAEVRYTHKLQFAYPDWNVSVFSDIQRYQHNGRVSSRASKVIPEGTAAEVSFFVPLNSIRYGASIGFGQGYFEPYRYDIKNLDLGQEYSEPYTHAWRPFGEINIFNNTRFGFGSYINIGIAGHVFGRDHLAIYYERGVNVEASNQKDYIIAASYQLYF
ncbi:MAG: tetratricopeptide repeat protein [Gammaproteobacteria bacterium]|jgi:hypothetical protein